MNINNFISLYLKKETFRTPHTEQKVEIFFFFSMSSLKKIIKNGKERRRQVLKRVNRSGKAIASHSSVLHLLSNGSFKDCFLSEWYIVSSCVCSICQFSKSYAKSRRKKKSDHVDFNIKFCLPYDVDWRSAPSLLAFEILLFFNHS